MQSGWGGCRKSNKKQKVENISGWDECRKSSQKQKVENISFAHLVDKDVDEASELACSNP